MSIRIGIPAIPEEIYQGLIKRRLDASNSLLDWKVKVDDRVEKGQIVAEYRVKQFYATHVNRGTIRTNASITAPCDGKILHINRIEHSKWDWDQLKPNKFSQGVWDWKKLPNNELEHLQEDNILFFLLTRGDVGDFTYTKANIVYENIADYACFAQSSRYSSFTVKVRNRFRKDVYNWKDFPDKARQGMFDSPLKVEEYY